MALTGRGRGAAPTIGQNRQGNDFRTLVACGVVSLVLFTVSARMGSTGPLEAVRSAFQTVTTPVRYLGATVSAPFQGLGNIFMNLTADQATLSDLKAQNEELNSRNIQLEGAQQEVERLQGLLDLQSAYSLKSTAARIISGSTDSWSTTVTIDKGSSSGLTVGMPVTGAAGVIGQIIECSATTSTVRLLTDEDSSVSAMVQSSGAQGMVQGSATGEVRLNLIRISQEVSVGDAVVTSGLGGVYPKGLPIGKVTSVESTPGALYYTVVVELFATPANNSEVLVITSLSEGQQATADEIASADQQETGGSASGGESASSDGSDSSSGGASDSGTNSSSGTNAGSTSAQAGGSDGSSQGQGQ